MNFDNKQKGRKTNRNKSLITSPKSPAIMVSVFSAIISPEIPNELCERFKLLLQEKEPGNNSDLIDEEFVAIADKLLEDKSISTKLHKFLLLKC